MPIQDNIPSSSSNDFIQSLERGLAVIRAFSAKHPSLSVTEAAQATGYSRPAVRRILLTLTELGYAKFKNGRFSLTPRILSLGYSYISSQSIWSNAHLYLEKLVEKTNESSSISILDEQDIVYVARIPTKRIMTISLNVGSRLPAYATSMGQILLAFLPDTALETYLSELETTQLTKKTIIKKDELRETLAKVRERGWSFVDEELEEGVRSIAVPLVNGEGQVIAAVNCSAHAGRISTELMQGSFLSLLQGTADLISKDLAEYQGSNYL